jgi:hypothetical protein
VPVAEPDAVALAVALDDCVSDTVLHGDAVAVADDVALAVPVSLLVEHTL